MAKSIVTVQSNKGSPIKGKRVVLIFKDGQTDPVFTNSAGEAVIDHRTVGSAEVHVAGKKRGTFRAPGTYPVTLDD